MMEALKVMTYFKVSLSTHNWDRAIKNRAVEPGSSEVGKTVRTASRLSSLTQMSIRRACQNLLRQ